jgi:hypothetical protein
MQPQHLARHASSTQGFDAVESQVGGFPLMQYLFARPVRILSRGYTQVACTLDPMCGHFRARASGILFRRDRCQRTLKQSQHSALSSLSPRVRVKKPKKNSLLWIQNQCPKNQYTQANLSKPVAKWAFYAPTSTFAAIFAMIPTPNSEGAV